MKINHVAMYVNDLVGARDFFIKYFAAKANEGYHNAATGFRSFFLDFENGCSIEIMNKQGVSAVEQGERIGYTHIAFSVGSAERVDELTERLRCDGFEILSGPRTTGDGFYESCVSGFEGNLIEITV